MATNLQALAFEKAELLSSRLKEIISSGQGYIQNQLGLDLGLNLDVYPTWVLLSTAAAGLLVVLVLSWVAICGGASVGKSRGSSFTKVQVEEPLKANLNNSVKPDDQKRKNKKKSSEKVRWAESVSWRDGGKQTSTLWRRSSERVVSFNNGATGFVLNDTALMIFQHEYMFHRNICSTKTFPL